MLRTALGIAFAAMLVAACGQKSAEPAAEVSGPVVSTSEAPRNDAVNTTPATSEVGPTPGANSFTEAQAKIAIEAAGYTDVGPLTQTDAGIWQAKAMKAGAEANVSVDYKGAVTAS